MIEFSKICLHQNLIFENLENPRIFFSNHNFFFSNVHKEVFPFLFEDKDGNTAEDYADRFHNFEVLNVIEVNIISSNKNLNFL